MPETATIEAEAEAIETPQNEPAPAAEPSKDAAPARSKKSDKAASDKVSSLMQKIGIPAEPDSDDSTNEPPSTKDAPPATDERETSDRKKTPEPKADKDQPAPAVEETPAVTPTARQRDMARQIGMTDADLAEITTQKELERIEKAGLAVRRAMAKAGNQQAAPEAEAESDSPASDDEDEFTDTDLYDGEEGPRKINALMTQVRSQAQELTELRALVTGVETKAKTTEADDFFGSLDKSYADLFGDGRTDDFGEDSDEALVRKEIIVAADAAKKASEASGRPLTQSQALNIALAALHPEKHAEAEKARIKAENEAERKRRQRSASLPASHSRGNPSTSASQAEADARIDQAIARVGLRFGH